LLITIPHFGPGGAQRVATLLLNHWHALGVRIAILTLFAKADAHPINPAIPREAFVPVDRADEGRGFLARAYVSIETRLQKVADCAPAFVRPAIRSVLWLQYKVRMLRAKLLASRVARHPEKSTPRAVWIRDRLHYWQPKVVISFLGATNIQTVMAARNLNLKVLISERNDPAIQKLDEPWEGLRPTVYPEADMVTANSAGALETMRRFVPERKLRQVSNPLLVPECPPDLDRHQHRMAYVGRLVEQKAPEVLLAAFALATEDVSDWTLDVIGDGPLRPALEQQAADLNAKENILFHGHCSNPYPLLYRASIFVLPSRFEGMPNAMLEAMGCGLAVIVSDASPGPLELIRDGETGLVTPVGDSRALAEAMKRLMQDPALRHRFSAASTRLAEGLRVDRVASQWEALIRELGVELIPSQTT
jgi:glycosyltransferase involved in cell wall biosynthesis